MFNFLQHDIPSIGSSCCIDNLRTVGPITKTAVIMWMMLELSSICIWHGSFVVASAVVLCGVQLCKNIVTDSLLPFEYSTSLEAIALLWEKVVIGGRWERLLFLSCTS